MLKNNVARFDNNCVVVSLFRKVVIRIYAEKLRMEHESLLLVSLARQDRHAKQIVCPVSVANG